MSEFVVDLSEPEKERPTEIKRAAGATADARPEAPKKHGGIMKILKVSGIILLVLFVLAAIAGFVYWQSVKRSPAYSLALLVDAARRDDQKMIDELVDTDAIVDSFLPQVIEKATEMYGKNVPTAALSNLTMVTDQFKPAIKKRAREEVPRVIREKTDKFESVPYWAIAIGAGWFLDNKETGETAVIVSRIPDRPFEVTMKRNGGVWRVVGIKDEVLARRIAEKIGQEIIAIASKDGLKKAGEKLGVESMDDVRKKLDEIFK